VDSLRSRRRAITAPEILGGVDPALLQDLLTEIASVRLSPREQSSSSPVVTRKMADLALTCQDHNQLKPNLIAQGNVTLPYPEVTDHSATAKPS
jgi:hypothetical protein